MKWVDDLIQQMTLTTQMVFSEKQCLHKSILLLSDEEFLNKHEVPFKQKWKKEQSL